MLPAAGYAEVGGTTTNLEGRVSVLGQKVTPPGTARADWMIAADLARLLGADLRLESSDEIWEEIEELAPSHAGITLELLRSADAADGVVAPLDAAPVHSTVTGPEGAAVGGTDVVDRRRPDHRRGTGRAGRGRGRGHPRRGRRRRGGDGPARGRGGRARRRDAAEARPGRRRRRGRRRRDAAPAGPRGRPGPPSRPCSPSRPPPHPRPSGPPVDAYSLRLVTTRKLYDRGTLVQHSRSLAGLAGTTALRVHPSDFDRLGIEAGTSVRAETARGSHTVEVAARPRGAAGTVVVGFNLGGIAATELIDATAPVNDLRLEVIVNVLAADPLFAGDVDLVVVLIVVIKTVIVFAFLLIATMLHDLVRAEDHRRHAEPHRPEPGRAVRAAAEPGRRGEGLLQGGPRSRSAPTGWCSSSRRTSRCSPRLLVFSVIPIGGSFSDDERGVVSILGRDTLLQLADPPIGILRRPRDVVDRGLRDHARRLVLGLEVPAARLGAGVGPDGLLRGRARPLGRRRRARVGHAQHQRHRGRAERVGLEPLGHRGRAVRDLPHRRHRRGEPAAVRPRRGGAGAGRRVQHRVQRRSASRSSTWPSS